MLSRTSRRALGALASGFLVAACAEPTAPNQDGPLLAAQAQPLVPWMKVQSLPYAFDLARAPNATLYAAGADLGVFRSTDGFRWESAGTIPDGAQPMALAAVSNDVIYAGTDNGVYRSHDGGDNWVPSGLAGLYVSHLAADDRGHVYATATGMDGGVFRSTDDGMRWTMIMEPLGRRESFYDFISVYRGDVFVGPYSQTPYYGRNGGESFEPLYAMWELPEFYGFADDLLETPNGSLIAAYAGGIGRSTDGGQSWKQVFGGLTSFGLLLGPDAREMYALVHEGRVHRSTDDGATWSPFAAAPPMTGIEAMAVAADGRVVVVGYEGVWKTVR